ncbi:hypothetical protein C1H70_15245 [Halomonas urumqiensis]|uniref:Sulfotransferase domain-containing protein n=2 Tax=Halomonas urumqiensis TaxID=1684789 RepID=A0A2N7UCF9_9GAMM|nr:hypothetical protein C1H70_15245 [Halomonas urumqiensis]
MLLEKGVCCPSITDIHKKLTRPYVYLGRNGFSLDELIDENCESVILSDEDLLGKYYDFSSGKVYPNSIANLEKAQELLEWESIDLWICLRDYGEWLESCFLQKLKWVGQFFSFESYCGDIDFKEFSWVSLLKQMLGLHFVNEVHVFFYEDFKRNNSIMFELVEREFGVKSFDLNIADSKMNHSFSSVGYELLSSLRGVEEEKFKKVGKFLLREFPSIDYGKPDLLSYVEKDLLRGRYSKDIDYIKNNLAIHEKKLIVHGG